MPKSRILLVASLDMSLLNFRGDLIKHLIANGYEVVCAAPNFTQENTKKIEELGAHCEEFSLQRTGLNPLKDYGSIQELKQIIGKNNIDLVFPYTIKPVVYSSIAAKSLNVPVVSLITGLGFTFSGVSTKAKILQRITETLYRYTLRSNKMVIFQNKDDQALFLEKKIISRFQKTKVVDGSGINLDWFSFHPRVTKETIDFVIVGRLMKEKGVNLLVEVAKELRTTYSQARFHFIGGPSVTGSGGISEEEFKKLHEQEIIVYHGKSNNVAGLLSKMDVFILPTYYREGVPRSILEALSSGMPIITTNTPGCKETVVEGVNGFLIKPKLREPLKKSVKYFIDNPEKIQEMGLESRKLAESKFDVQIINSHILDSIIYVLNNQKI